MRSSKYHDYRVLKVVMFIILVVLGLFIYVKCIKAPLEHEHVTDNSWVVEKEATCTSEGLKYNDCTDCGDRVDEVIPMTEHTAGKKKTENTEASTCTVGGSHDEVVYCTECGYEISRKTVQDELAPHTPGEAQKDNEVLPTHVGDGSYDMIVRCTECNAELSDHADTRKGIVIPATGHEYEWELIVDEENIEFALVGTCTCDEEGNTYTFTEADGLVVRFDDRYAPCCVNRYFISFTYYDLRFEETVEFDTHSHTVAGSANIGDGDFPIEILASYDENGDIYYDWSKDAVRKHLRLTADHVWEYDGFGIAFFTCTSCNAVECDECWTDEMGYSWLAVRVYWVEQDNTLMES